MVKIHKKELAYKMYFLLFPLTDRMKQKVCKKGGNLLAKVFLFWAFPCSRVTSANVNVMKPTKK